jgi:hypothetical protein
LLIAPPDAWKAFAAMLSFVVNVAPPPVVIATDVVGGGVIAELVAVGMLPPPPPPPPPPLPPQAARPRMSSVVRNLNNQVRFIIFLPPE